MSFLLVAAFQVPAVAQHGPDVTEENWLVAGPFPGAGANALFKDHLRGSTSEQTVRARSGAVASQSPGGTTVWREAGHGPNGRIDFAAMWPGRGRRVAYAYTELLSPSAGYVVATLGSGNNVQVRLNGEIAYESRLSRKPEPDKDLLVLRLRRGINPLLVKVEGGPPHWELRWRTHRVGGRLFVNQRATVVPDFRIGEPAGAWGQVEVANASAAGLTDVTVEVAGDGLVLPSRSEAVSLGPGEVRRIPVWVAGKTGAPAAGAKALNLRVTGGGEVQSFEFTPRVRKRDEYFVTTYRSSVDGSVQPYSVLLPTSFDRSRSYPLIMLLHGANVTDWGQNIVSYEPKEWAIQIAAHGRGNNRYREIGEVDLEEVLAAVKSEYKIDEESMYLSGHSMGGYGTWFQATRRPDRWASISPQAGYADYFIYHPAMREGRAPLLRPFQRRLLEHWSPLLFAENLLHVPAYVVHGAKDDNVVPEHSRKMVSRLRELGYTHVYDENPEGGHWWGPRGAYYGVEVVDKPPIWTFFQKHSRRKRLPGRVVYTTDTLRYRGAYWVRVDELDRANRMARIEAERRGPDTFSVRLDNVTQFTLNLDGLVADGAAVGVTVDGGAAYRGPLPVSKRLTLRREAGGKFSQLFNRGDAAGVDERIVAELDAAGAVARVAARESAPLKKSERLYGPVSDAFNSPFLFVTGTAGKDADAAALRDASSRAAQALARDWAGGANGIVRLKRDADVTRGDIASYNLILFGNARINSLIAQINDELPVRFKAGGIDAGGEFFAGEDVGMVSVSPNPLNRERYALVVGGTTSRSFETAARLRPGELPDYVIFDRHALEGEEPAYVAGGFFDKFWRPEAPARAALATR